MKTTNYPEFSKPKLTEAKSIGCIAFASQSTPQQGMILGKTSRGIFIKSSSKWLVFISNESYQSPLTITLHENEGALQKLKEKMPVQISPTGFAFPDAGLEISTQNSLVWQPQKLNAHPIPTLERQSRLENSLQRIRQMENGTSHSPLLPSFNMFQSAYHRSTQEPSSVQSTMLRLQEEMDSSNHLPNAETVTSLLGYGSGLTPSGDDFIVGLLLALNRWKGVLAPSGDLNTLNHRVVEAAYEKTTTLSANLIECAASGLADERLIAALDWLMSGNSRDSDFVDELLSWGNSSGMDVFMGFAIALSLPQTNQS